MDSFTYVEMEELIRIGQAKILKKTQRRNDKNLYRYLVEYNSYQYLSCNCCNMFFKLDYFTDAKGSKFANKVTDCKECRRKASNKEYHNDFLRHLHIRYASIKSISKKYNVPYISYEEFVDFAKTVKEPIYGLTLEGAFNKNMSVDFDIEHKIPISNGGTSLLDNLFLSYKPFNRLKGTMSVEEAIEFAKLIIKHEEDIRKSYNLN